MSIKLNIPALTDLVISPTRHRLPPAPGFLGTYTAITEPERELCMVPLREVYRMEMRLGCQKTVPEHATVDHRRFVERSMRRELVQHVYGGLLFTLAEARRAAQHEQAAHTYEILAEATAALDALMEEASHDD